VTGLIGSLTLTACARPISPPHAERQRLARREVAAAVPELGHEVLVAWSVRAAGPWLRWRDAMNRERAAGLAGGRPRPGDGAGTHPGG
jgi:hypothetical protein